MIFIKRYSCFWILNLILNFIGEFKHKAMSHWDNA